MRARHRLDLVACARLQLPPVRRPGLLELRIDQLDLHIDVPCLRDRPGAAATSRSRGATAASVPCGSFKASTASGFGVAVKTRHGVVPTLSPGSAFTSVKNGSKASCSAGIGSLSGPSGFVSLISGAVENGALSGEPISPNFLPGAKPTIPGRRGR